MSDTGFPGSHMAIVDPKTGLATNAYWRLLESLWRRVGGFDDILDASAKGDANLLALVNALEESIGLSEIEIERVSRTATRLAGFDEDVIAKLIEDRDEDLLRRLLLSNDEGDANLTRYTNKTSGLSASDVQAAIDELAASSSGGAKEEARAQSWFGL